MSMISADTYRRCRDLVRAVRVPRPFSATAFSASLAEQRGRRLYVHPLPHGWAGDGTPCGVWLATKVADHVFFEEQTSRFHQEHIILHELGHMMCGHALPELAEDLDSALRGPNSGSALARHALMRTSYDNDQEQEAELVATLLLERARRVNEPADAKDRWLRSAFGVDHKEPWE